MTPQQWRLARRAVDEVSAAGGLTDRMLAERLGISADDLKPITGMLIGRGRLQRCDSYLVVVPDPSGPETGAAA